jgi:hypothetical protein
VAQRIDHFTVAPDTLTETFGERVFLAMFNLMFALKCPPWRVVNPRCKDSVGVGAFNLVRAEAFRAIGGFRGLALSVDDDMRLGQALKFAGYQPGVALARGAVSVRWHVGVLGMIRGIEKNFFAAIDFSPVMVVVGVCGVLLVGVFPFVGVLVGPIWARVVCALGVASMLLVLRAGNAQRDVKWYHGLFLPFGALAIEAALALSVFHTLRNGGVRWRDHLYPLRELRNHVRLRNAWLADVWRSTR